MAGFGFWQLNLSTAQNDFSKFRPGWWQFCWMTGVKFNSIHSILVRFLHITQFTVCAARNLTVFVADSPRCLEWSSMVAAVSRALRELLELCLGWTREPRRQPKSLGARRQYSQATANNVLPVMTGSPAFLTRPPPGHWHWWRPWVKMKSKMLSEQGKSEGFDSCHRPSNLTQIGFKIVAFSACVTLKFYGWPKNIIVQLFYTTPSFVHHFKSICEFKLVTVRKRSILVKIGNFLSRVTLKFIGWHWKILGHLFYAMLSFVHYFKAIDWWIQT